MAARVQLDLIGVVSPLCLLKFRSEIAKLHARDVMEIRIEDPVAAEDLMRIANRSADQVIGSEERDDHFRILVEKG